MIKTHFTGIISSAILALTLFTTACAEEPPTPEEQVAIQDDVEQVSASPQAATTTQPQASLRSGWQCGTQASIDLYDRTNFRGEGDHLATASCGCNEMPAWYVNHLYSSTAGTPSEICVFYRTRNCTGNFQCVDHAGYRNMTNLPAYYSFSCYRTAGDIPITCG